MAKRISETQRLITFGLGATKEGLNMAIETLTAIRDKNFPVEKKSRKPRKVKEKPTPILFDAGAAMGSRTAKSKGNDDEPKPIARKCTNCDWKGKTAFPEPCPKCNEKTEAA